jgi:hypothetical protein
MASGTERDSARKKTRRMLVTDKHYQKAAFRAVDISRIRQALLLPDEAALARVRGEIDDLATDYLSTRNAEAGQVSGKLIRDRCKKGISAIDQLRAVLVSRDLHKIAENAVEADNLAHRYLGVVRYVKIGPSAADHTADVDPLQDLFFKSLEELRGELSAIIAFLAAQKKPLLISTRDLIWGVARLWYDIHGRLPTAAQLLSSVSAFLSCLDRHRITPGLMLHVKQLLSSARKGKDFETCRDPMEALSRPSMFFRLVNRQ